MIRSIKGGYIMDRVMMEMFKDGRKVAKKDITNMTAIDTAHLADIQQELQGRTIHIKRTTT